MLWDSHVSAAHIYSATNVMLNPLNCTTKRRAAYRTFPIDPLRMILDSKSAAQEWMPIHAQRFTFLEETR
jgi:hypothetical protein